MNQKAYTLMFRVLLICLLVLAGLTVSTATNPEVRNGGGGLSKAGGDSLMTILNINNFTTFMRADGQGNHDPANSAGGRYPRTASTALYEDGFVWGGKTYLDAGYSTPSSQLVRVGGQTYNQGTRQGWVVGTGSTAVSTDPGHPRARIYRVRRDYKFMSKEEAAADVSTLKQKLIGEVTTADIAALRAKYEQDWNEWPVDLGAPYVERNGQPGYQPPPAFNDDSTVAPLFTPAMLISGNYDEPGIAGIDPKSPADQVVWTVFNDLERSATLNLYKSEPMGLEGQVTLWGYKRTDALGNLYFKRLKIINKGGVVINTAGDKGSFYIDSMYVSQWSDPDLGDSGDDLCGSDVALSLGFAYNGNPVDVEYRKFNLAPPAVGYDFLQGPLVNGLAGDSAVFDLKRVYGKKNLPLTAFVYFSAGSPISDPTLGNSAGASYESTLKWWKMLRGYRPDGIGVADRYYPFPPGIQPGPFCLSGDPTVATDRLRDGIGTDFSLAPGDRRIILASGPFRLAPGDTQEVVMGTVAGLGGDRLSSVKVMKFNDRFVQNTYNDLFAVPSPPPTPDVKYTQLDGHVIFEWGSNSTRVAETEAQTFEPGEYVFEGYNVYQLKDNQNRDLSNALRIATYDLITDPAVVLDEQFDVASGQILVKPVQYGSNSGVSRFFDFNRDFVRDIPRLNNGTVYTIAITAYTVSRVGYLPASLESSPFYVAVTPQSIAPGVRYGQTTGEHANITHNGTASGGPEITMLDPASATGHDYEVYFTERQEIRNQGGDWIPASVLRRHPRGDNPDTLTGSSIDVAARYGITSGRYELHCSLDLVSDSSYSDGLKMVLPPGVTILEVPSFIANNTDAINGGVIDPVFSGNTIVFGDTSHPYSGNGPFAGGEEWVIYVSGLTIPSAIDWTVYDDGFGSPLDESGTTTVVAIGNASRLGEYWNMKDATTNVVKLQNQSVVNGVDKFPKRDDIPTNFGMGANPIVDGFQVGVNDVVYDAPINFLDVSLEPGPGSTTRLTSSSSTSTLDIQNYTIFSGTVSSKARDNFGAGTNDINELQKDYELRFTGVWDSVTVGGQKRYFVASGGQMATIFSTAGGAAGLATHPMNPNPGTASPFLIRIPFEVWCKDDNRQVNLAFRDRIQTPTSNPFYAWNTKNRMYAIIVNSPYNDQTPTPVNASATWALVFYGTNASLGDVVTVTYANPIQTGSDTYTFKTTLESYSAAAAKNDVGRVNVFPNPYYAFNPREISRTSRFVTFNHLPTHATIRIFNLAGQLVRTLQHGPDVAGSNGQFRDWDLANESNFPVASGMYIVHIDMPEIGATKILKVGIIQEQEIPNNF
jgi:hypothetical protein